MKKITTITIGIILLIFVALILNTYQKSNDESEMYVVTMTAANMRPQFTAGNIDGALVHEPVAADLVFNYNASYLIQTSEIWPNHPCCLLSTNMKDDEAVQALVWAHLKATEFINDQNNEEKVINYATDFTGLGEKVVREAMKNLRYAEYPNEKEIKNYYYKLSEAGLFKKSLTELGYENDEDFFSELFNGSYYDYIKKNPEWEPGFIDKTVRLGYFSANLHHLAAYVALKEGYYAVFQKVELVSFPQGHAAMDAYLSNLIDASYIGVPPLLLKRINTNTPVTIIGGANEEGSALIVKNDIKSLKDLRGKTVAILGLGTMPDFLLRLVAEKAELEFKLKK